MYYNYFVEFIAAGTINISTNALNLLILRYIRYFFNSIIDILSKNISSKVALYYSNIAFLNSEGEQPFTCLKTRLKVFILLKPELNEISDMESDVLISRFTALDTL